jgi:hypothetical protein
MIDFLETEEGKSWYAQSMERLLTGRPVQVSASCPGGPYPPALFLNVDLVITGTPGKALEVTRARIRGQLPPALISCDDPLARQIASEFLTELAQLSGLFDEPRGNARGTNK